MLVHFLPLIESMPVYEQAFMTKKLVWIKQLNDTEKISLDNDKKKKALFIIESIFDDKDHIFISRKDVFNASNKDSLKNGNGMENFILMTIFWGYPRGMRGNNFSKLINNLDELVSTLTQVCNENWSWDKHCKELENIKGIRLSTYSKLLYFLSIKVEEFPALILDQKITEALKRGVFFESGKFNGINYYNAPSRYVDYLKEMQNRSETLDVQSDKIEMFLFEFGLNLKL